MVEVILPLAPLVITTVNSISCLIMTISPYHLYL